MLILISSISTTVREGFEVQDLPPRATPVSAEHMSEVFGSACKRTGGICWVKETCCPGYYCRYAGRIPPRCEKA